MLRWLTAGESHGEALVGVLEGLPAGVQVTTRDIQDALARRRLGYGRGARMKFEQDEVRILGGLRLGLSQGGPVAIEIGNTEWPKWVDVMSADPVDDPEKLNRARNAPLTRPRPGHADLVGMRKYAFDDARPVLERASARETATRVALGTVAARFLEQAAGIRLVSHVVQIGPVGVPDDAAAAHARRRRRPRRRPGALRARRDVGGDGRRDRRVPRRGATRSAASSRCSPTACRPASAATCTATAGSTRGSPARSWASRRSRASRSATASGPPPAAAPQAHDEIERDAVTGRIRRLSNRAGGIEGGMANGEVVRVRAAMKPISTVPRALATIDTASGEPAKAQHQRSDVCAVPPAAVVAEAMVALVLADTLLEKFGGDSVGEVARNVQAYLAAVPELQR